MKGIQSYINLYDNLEIRLNANESYFGIDEKMKLDIKTYICNLELNRYPEDSSEVLKELYGGYAGVDKENIVVGNGSDEMIGLVIGLNIAEGKKLLTLNPDFSMYDYYVSMHSGKMVKYNTKEDGSFDIDEFIELGKKENVLWVFKNVEGYEEKTGHKYIGGSNGVSMRICKGVYYHVGASKGHSVAYQYQTPLGRGIFVVTNKYLYFLGVKQVKLSISKILSFEPYSDGIVLVKDGTNPKPYTFIGFDSWFVVNAMQLLVE